MVISLFGWTKPRVKTDNITSKIEINYPFKITNYECFLRALDMISLFDKFNFLKTFYVQILPIWELFPDASYIYVKNQETFWFKM